MVESKEFGQFSGQQAAIDRAMDEPLYAGELRFLQSAVGAKYMATVEDSYGALPLNSKIRYLKIALMDAFPAGFASAVSSALTHYGPALWQSAVDYAQSPATSTELVPYNGGQQASY
jgi:hypothetical protein